ncbi:MAG: SAM-dependent methyltransferase [Planctomycetaceae bacterium]|nr:SAM-dependent methyltransferase [Planctomycetaceae bacterium]
MDVLAHNREFWDRRVAEGDRWTVPVDAATVQAARAGRLELLLTPLKPVPREWYPPLAGLPTLCLASGGGQQGPLLAAAGAEVTVFDYSPRQLGQDRLVADREGLALATVQGDMADLSCFADESFGLIFHPCSNCFAENVLPVWRECFRVLRPGGVLLAGFNNPVRYIFEDALYDNGVLTVCNKLPYRDADHFDDPKLRQRIVNERDAMEFGHTLQDQIGGQLRAGFVLTALFEDRFDPELEAISQYMDTFIATRALKPR